MGEGVHIRPPKSFNPAEALMCNLRCIQSCVLQDMELIQNLIQYSMQLLLLGMVGDTNPGHINKIIKLKLLKSRAIPVTGRGGL
jgi:hypothetical protein